MNNEKDKKESSQQSQSDLYSPSGLILKPHLSTSAEKQAIIKRTEKIVTAIYLVSSLLPDADPLRLSLRSQSLEFLSFVTHAVDFLQNNADSVVAKTQSIISLLTIAYFSGYVSEMNKNILIKELEWFAHEVTHRGHFLLSGVVIEEGYFAAPESQVKNQSFIGQVSQVPGQAKIAHQGQSQRRNKQLAPRAISPRKNQRKQNVIDVLKKNGPINIKDIVAQVKDCSEKTIQRELASLIKDKLVKRNGERRWSIYSLV